MCVSCYIVRRDLYEAVDLTDRRYSRLGATLAQWKPLALAMAVSVLLASWACTNAPTPSNTATPTAAPTLATTPTIPVTPIPTKTSQVAPTATTEPEPKLTHQLHPQAQPNNRRHQPQYPPSGLVRTYHLRRQQKLKHSQRARVQDCPGPSKPYLKRYPRPGGLLFWSP